MTKEEKLDLDISPYKYIQTTEGNNGLPLNTDIGIIGFTCIEDAEDFAEEHDLTVVSFHRKKFDSYWKVEYCTDKAYNMIDFYIDKKDYIVLSDYKECDVVEELKSQIQKAKDFDECETIFAKYASLQECINEMYSPDEFILGKLGSYPNYEIMPKWAMDFEYEGNYYAIGVY